MIWKINQVLIFVLLMLSLAQVHLARQRHQAHCQYYFLMTQIEELLQQVNLKRAEIMKSTNSLALLEQVPEKKS